MKIISNFKDYYDFIYPEGGCVYKRMPGVRTVNNTMLKFTGSTWQHPANRIQIGYYTLTPREKQPFDNHKYSMKGGMVVLHGKIVHKFLMVNMGGYPTEYKAFHSVESLLEKFKVDGHVIMNHLDRRLADWFKIEESDKYIFQKVDDVPLYISYTNDHENVLVNPCLMQLGITNINPMMMIQEIENFLHEKEEARLNEHNPTGDDVVLRNSKGFDNNSFKHRT